jgi:hypothetical protein
MARTIAGNNQDKKLEYEERFTKIFETNIERFFGDEGNTGFDLDRVKRLEVENKALDIYSKSVTADIKRVQEENTRLKEYISTHQDELIAAVG